MIKNPYLGLNTNSRSPGSIVNAEFHDETGCEKNIDGEPGTILAVLADSTIATPIKDFSMVRVCNTSASVQFIWFGMQSLLPGSIDITTSFALPAGFVTLFHAGASTDPVQSIVVATSSADVQVVIIES